MMGRRERGQGQFFYVFDLDKVVPLDHLVRQIDGVVDLIGCTRILHSGWHLAERCTVARSGLTPFGGSFGRRSASLPRPLWRAPRRRVRSALARHT
jgi:hypothetical protein